MKSVIISIRPKWCEKIVSGEKTIEVRKTKPKIDGKFKCYIYCTSIKALNLSAYCEIHAKTGGHIDDWNGKVIGEFVCNYVETMKYPHNGLVDIVDERESCVSARELIQYSNGNLLYAWHISALKIYDKPRELSEFGLKRPPQSWQYVESEVAQ